MYLTITQFYEIIIKLNKKLLHRYGNIHIKVSHVKSTYPTKTSLISMEITLRLILAFNFVGAFLTRTSIYLLYFTVLF